MYIILNSYLNQNLKTKKYEIFKIFILICIYLCTVIKIKILVSNYEYFSINISTFEFYNFILNWENFL